MPSRASTSLLLIPMDLFVEVLKSVSMPSRASTSLLHKMERVTVQLTCLCQCPLGLVLHCYDTDDDETEDLDEVSMPSRASTSLLQYPFKNLGFMRFPEPVFAGICQNILTVTHFHAC